MAEFQRSINNRLERSDDAIRRLVVPEYHEYVLSLRDGQKQFYRDLEQEIGHLGLLWYPAGSADALPIQMTDVLVIVDCAPFLNTTNEISSIVQTSLSHIKKPSIKQLLSGTNGVTLRDAMKEKIRQSEARVSVNLLSTIADGFEPVGKGRNEENLEDILAHLVILGIDVENVVMRKIPTGYHLSFKMDNQDKHLFYMTESLPSMDDTSVKYETRKTIVERFNVDIRGRVSITGAVGVLKKADIFHVADNFLLLHPDVLLFDNANSIPLVFMDIFGYEYDLRQFRGLRRYGRLDKYGYTDPRGKGINPFIAFKRNPTVS